MLNSGFLHGPILELVFLQYIKMTYLEHSQNWFLYFADNTCVSYKYKYFEKVGAAL